VDPSVATRKFLEKILVNGPISLIEDVLAPGTTSNGTEGQIAGRATVRS
jgi:hypothetical protein